MAQSLDLEEQEQLDQIKHFWKRYGNLITWVLLAASVSFAGWNGWQFWQHKQASGAAILFEEIERAVADKDAARMERTLADMKGQFGSTAYAQQGALLAAHGLVAAGDAAKAKQALEWAAGQSKDEGLQAIARLRLAGLLMDSGDADAAKKTLEATLPAKATCSFGRGSPTRRAKPTSRPTSCWPTPPSTAVWWKSNSTRWVWTPRQLRPSHEP
jgi:predicted negative regulator of RcsB-dependent stress response